MESFQTFVILMFAAAILVGIAQKMHMPYPIALVVAGAAIGFTPFLKGVNFDPTLLLGIVLPPILYYAAFGIPIREFTKNGREILSLALGLVVVTTLIIGILFKWLFPQYPWALAFTFGALISPPDAVAATAILKRFSIHNRLLTVLEGESLVNDASALVLYRLGVTALLSGAFSLAEASLNFVQAVLGGIFLGWIMGYALQHFSRRYLEPVVAVVFSFTIPYVTYLAAEFLGVSGVLAVVVNGLLGSQVLIKHYSSLRRILGYATWDIFIILMNCFVFILIGLQLRFIVLELSYQQILTYTAYALLFTLAMIAIRMAWVYAKSGFAYVKALRSPRSETLCPQILREATILGWSGMRGIVSLAAALALPLTLPNGSPLGGRDEVIFMTFIVILATLIVPGISLAPLVSWLKIQHHSEKHALLKVRNDLAQVAEKTLQNLRTENKIDLAEFEFLKAHHDLQIQTIKAHAENKLLNLDNARDFVIQEKRRHLFVLWESQEIDDALLSKLEHELDLEETHVTRAELK